jgi:response regulator RpfG family c-di-GMP phosphodiesterase
VLLKPSALNEEEQRIMETHPEIGDKLLEPLDLLAGARPIVRHHHERWDGAGYPDRLSEDSIPLGARIVSVADSVEVMSSRQLYRQPRTTEQIIDELHAMRGKQWDPQIVDLMLGLIASGELELKPEGLRLLEQAPVKAIMPGLSVLLVEDDDDHAELVTAVLERALEGAIVSRAGTVAGAAELSNGAAWSLAVVDHNLPDGLGMQVLDALRANDPTMPILMLTGQGSEETAIEAFRHGASDYVVKGGGYLDALASRVRGLVTSK